MGAETRTVIAAEVPVGDEDTTHGHPRTSAFTPPLGSQRSRSFPRIAAAAANAAPSAEAETTATANDGFGLGTMPTAESTGRGSDVGLDLGDLTTRRHRSTILARYVRMACRSTACRTAAMAPALSLVSSVIEVSDATSSVSDLTTTYPPWPR
jgi:hypothetical protein